MKLFVTTTVLLVASAGLTFAAAKTDAVPEPVPMVQTGLPVAALLGMEFPMDALEAEEELIEVAQRERRGKGWLLDDRDDRDDRDDDRDDDRGDAGGDSDGDSGDDSGDDD